MLFGFTLTDAGCEEAATGEGRALKFRPIHLDIPPKIDDKGASDTG